MTMLPIKIDKGSGEPILLIHGLGNNSNSWTYVLEKLDYSKNHIVTVDLLGFGEADKPSDCDYTPQDHADAVIKTIDSLGLKNIVIAGHSMGCLVAIEVARQRPDLAKHLILLGAPLFSRVPNRFDRLKFWKKEDFYSKLFRIISKKKDLTLTAAKGVNLFAPLVKGMEITDETWPAFTRSLRNTIVQTGSYKALKTTKTPTLLIYGALDLFVIKRNLKRAARHNKKYVTYESALGPHEITPVHGKSIAELIQSHT